MWGLEEDAAKVEVRNCHASNSRPEQKSTHSQHAGWGSRWCRWQGRPQFPRDTSGGSPSSAGGSSNWGSDWSSQQLTMMRVSRESNWPVLAGKGLWVKVNLLIFKDKKAKDAVTYHSWQWDITTFHCLGWDDQHLLPYVFWSLLGFPGDLARSLGKDATLNDILQTWALWSSNDVQHP